MRLHGSFYGGVNRVSRKVVGNSGYVLPAKATLYAPAPGYSEGPTWKNGSVFFCSGGLLRIGPDRTVRRYLDLNPAGTLLLADGRMLICDNKHDALLHLGNDGRVGVIADRWRGRPLRLLNDLTVDAVGNIYWTDPKSFDPKRPDGNVFRVTPEGRVDRIATGRYFPNGIDIDPQGRFLYLVESSLSRVLRYDLPLANRPLGRPQVFYQLHSGGDGCAFDARGNLWVAHFGAGEIVVISPQGRKTGVVKVPAKAVSNLTFGGPRRDTLFVTTGTPDGVFRVPVGVTGLAPPPGAKQYAMRRYLPIRPR